MKMLRLFILTFVFAEVANCYPVYTSTGSFDQIQDNDPSFAKSAFGNIELPERFTICTSVKFISWSFSYFISLLGKDSTGWMLPYFVTSNDQKSSYDPGHVVVWVWWNYGFYQLGSLKEPKLDFWYCICLKIDFGLNEINLKINGSPIGRAVGMNITNHPTTLQMTMGTEYKQFLGSLINTQVFTDGQDGFNGTDIPTDTCVTPEDLLSWNPQTWEVLGKNWNLVEEKQETICEGLDIMLLAIPVNLSIYSAMDVCKKLRDAIIPHQEDEASLNSYLSWYHNITGGSCDPLWTPFSDGLTEGLWVNMYDKIEDFFVALVTH